MVQWWGGGGTTIRKSTTTISFFLTAMLYILLGGVSSVPLIFPLFMIQKKLYNWPTGAPRSTKD